jgi:hypothetical protein
MLTSCAGGRAWGTILRHAPLRAHPLPPCRCAAHTQRLCAAPLLSRPGWTVQQGPTLKGGPGDHVRVYTSRDSQTGARMVAKVYSKKDIRHQPELRRMVSQTRRAGREAKG